MEPLDEKELSQLLRQWDAPQAPQSLQERVLPRPVSPWRWLLTGSIRIPAPLGIAAVLVLALWVLANRTPPTPVAQPPSSISLGDFHAVQRLEPTIVENGNEVKTDENKPFK